MSFFGILSSQYRKIVTSSQALAAALFYDPFTSKTVTLLPWIGWNQEQDANPSTDITITSSFGRVGNTCLRVEVNTASLYETRWRSELRTASTSSLNQWEHWFGFSHYYPPSFVSDTAYEIVWQLHSSDDPDDIDKSPELNFRIEEDYHQIEINYSSVVTQSDDNVSSSTIPLGIVTRSAWIDYVIYYKARYDDTGVLKVWKNNVLMNEWYGPNAYNDEWPPYHKIGIYKPGWNGPTNTSQRVIFIDEYRVAGSGSGYSIVHPTGDSEPAAFSPTASETLVFRESFPVTGSSDKGSDNLGWILACASGSVSSSAKMSTASGANGASDHINLNCGYNIADIIPGYLYSNPSTDKRFHYTNKVLNISRTGRELTRVKFKTAHGNTAWNDFACFQVSGSWYLYDYAAPNNQGTSSGNSSANDPTAFATFTKSNNQVIDITKFRLITFTPGSVLSIGGGNVTLPNGTVTGVGFYSERSLAATSRLRFDAFEIYTTAV